MRRWVVVLLFLILGTVAVSGLGYMGRKIPYTEQQPLYAMIQTVSGIMFGIFGLWIALLYPDLRQKVFSVDGNKEANSHVTQNGVVPADEVQQADHILEPFFVSLFVLLVTVVVMVVAPVVRRMPALQIWAEVIRGMSFGLIGLLTVLEITTILRAMRVTDGLKAALGQGKAIQQVKARIRQNRDKGSNSSESSTKG